jgi:hypothetical protein
MSPEEVHLILKGWLDDDSQLTIIGSLVSVTCWFRCRLTRLGETRVALSTDDGGVLTFDLGDPETVIQYSELREFPDVIAMLGLGDEYRFAPCMIFQFPNRVSSKSEATEGARSEMLYLIKFR